MASPAVTAARTPTLPPGTAGVWQAEKKAQRKADEMQCDHERKHRDGAHGLDGAAGQVDGLAEQRAGPEAQDEGAAEAPEPLAWVRPSRHHQVMRDPSHDKSLTRDHREVDALGAAQHAGDHHGLPARSTVSSFCKTSTLGIG